MLHSVEALIILILTVALSDPLLKYLNKYLSCCNTLYWHDFDTLLKELDYKISFTLDKLITKIY